MGLPGFSGLCLLVEAQPNARMELMRTNKRNRFINSLQQYRMPCQVAQCGLMSFILVAHSKANFLATTQIGGMLYFLIQGYKFNLRIRGRHQIILDGDG